MVIIFIILLISLIFLKRFFNGKSNVLTRNLSGQVVIVTGANAGIGFQTAMELAKMGAQVILACRNLERGQEAKQQIDAVALVKSELIHLDLASFYSVRKFVQEFKAKYNQLHILINNGGLLNPIDAKSYTQDGFEMHFGTNYLGHFLLTNLLLDTLRKTPRFRILNISSSLYRKGILDLADINFENRIYSGVPAYGQSKLAINLSTIQLQKKLDTQNIVGKAVSIHPGVVRSEGQRYIKESKFAVLYWLFYPLIWFITKNLEQGVQTILHCAVIDLEKLEGGKFYKECAVVELKHRQITEEMAEELWDYSLKTTKL